MRDMALFKVMKGGKSRLNDQSLKDGYAYFTTDDNGFYIDANPVNESGESTGSVTRRRVNDADNTSFDAEGMNADTVTEAILEVKTLANAANKSLSYDASTETLTLS